eukprot:TRINITY_DN2422_c0_g1_i4.p1 TRINITY_DN2422_c0_g1~~TRINITY_DN2422_c0_g1_i4.p1  ORF type:complete len:449 (-),score=105.66 TRINITY_DN2422_c0_g1_i4:404-1750(-)
MSMRRVGGGHKSEPNGQHRPPLPPDIVGTFSNHGIEQNLQDNETVKINQDRGSVDYPFLGGPRSALFCVMDGHGRSGEEVSDWCILNLHEELAGHEEDMLANPGEALTEAYISVDRRLYSNPKIDSTFSGTSAVTVYMSKDGKLWIANAGDSRAVLGADDGGRIRAVDLSRDHNPDSPGEFERLEARGGYVEGPEEEGLSARVWTPDMRIGLSMARSLGDHMLAQYGVVSEPEITLHQTSDQDRVLILASDGVWEFITSQEAVDIVSEFPDDATQACSRLMLEATQRWRIEEGPYRDDITAIVVFIPPLLEHFDLMQLRDMDISNDTNNRTAEARGSEIFQQDVMVNSNSGGQSPPNGTDFKDNARGSTFRRRRLSTSDSVREQAKTAVLAHLAGKSEPENSSSDAMTDAPPNRSFRRRPSLSLDMDPTGTEIFPKALLQQQQGRDSK